jgi:hypothetical protein
LWFLSTERGAVAGNGDGSLAGTREPSQSENQRLATKEQPMISKRLYAASPGHVPGTSGRETPEPAPIRNKTIPGRWAGITGASFAIAVIAGLLTYYATGKTGASIAWGFLAVGGAFASAFSFLNGVID